MNKSDLDAEFERLFDEAACQSERLPLLVIPDPADSWRMLQKKLLKEQRRAVWMRRVKWSSFGAVSLAAGAVLFSTLQTTEAFRPMFDMVYKVKGNTMTINIGSTDHSPTSGAKTAPPPPDDMLPPPKVEDSRDLPNEPSFRRVKVTLEEAAENTQFVLPKPGYIPAGYTLQETTAHLTLGQSKASAVKLVYHSDNDALPLQIVVRKRSYSELADRPDGQRSVTGPTKDGTELEWNDQDINVIIKAELGDKELNRIADGMSAK
jgi:hypothetical protein